MRVLLICPIPVEHTSCRTALALRDGASVVGCRTAHGSVAKVDIVAMESGPAKARAASATAAGIAQFQPDLVMDTGACGALDGDLIVKGMVLGLSCIEYDISGDGLPRRIIPEMKLPSALELLPRRGREKLVRDVTELSTDVGVHVRAGTQACGEFFIQSTHVRDSLHLVSGASASNWETAGVFISALRARIPPLSLRVITDLGDEDSLRDFRRNARAFSHQLYGFLRSILESGWVAAFHQIWSSLPKAQVEKMPELVLP